MYRFEVQLTPQIHNGSMKYFWHIFLVDGESKHTVVHGWAVDAETAFIHGRREAKNKGLI